MGAPEPARSSRVALFSVFELDFGKNELRKRGRVVKLQRLPLRMLLLLVSRAGQTVTREQLHAAVWPEGTFVAFDAGLNTAIRKVRQALGDDSGQARFIETLPREGYRFIAPVRFAPPEVLAFPNVVSSPATARLAPVRTIRPLWIWLAITFLVVTGTGAWVAGRFARPRPLVVISAEPLGSLEGPQSFPAISPDGGQIAFSWGATGEAHQGIYLMSVRGGEPRLLTPETGVDIGPAWSPDGARMAFRHWTGSAQAVMVAPATGGAPREVAETDGYFVAWTPDSQSVLFTVKSQKASGFELWSVPASGGEPRQISAPAERVNPYGRFGYSPDGAMLAYESLPAPSEQPQIMVRKADGGTARKVTALHSHLLGWTWTPDGGGFVISTDSEGFPRLYEVRLDRPNTEPVLIAGAGEDAQYPAMTAGLHAGSGRFELVYSIPRLAANLYGAALAWNREGMPRLEGAAPTRFLTSTRTTNSPQISPDSTKIVFISNRSGFSEIWLAGIGGDNPIQLTHFASPEHQPGSPRWSPDGSRLVFDVGELRVHHIYALSIKGGALRQLTEGTDDTVRPSWSRNGEWIYFGSKRTGRWEIWRIPASGGAEHMPAATRIAGSTGFEAFESVDGSTLYCATDTEPRQLWSVPVNGGAPSLVIDKGIYHGWWVPTLGGIIYADLTPQKTHRSGDLPVLFHSLRARRAVVVTSIAQKVFEASPGLAVSPDGRRLVLDRIDDDSTNLMLVSLKR